MRLSELLRQKDFVDEKIEIITTYKTANGEYAVLGRQGQPAFPISPGTTHLIEITPEDRDPEVTYPEELSIRRRLGLRTPPFRFPSKHE
jgi:hypothetical protein